MKPKIICHIMSSIDGRLIDGCWAAPYEVECSGLLKVYAVIVGPLTMRRRTAGGKIEIV